jgi:PadR family transcriptional regulator PadR
LPYLQSYIRGFGVVAWIPERVEGPMTKKTPYLGELEQMVLLAILQLNGNAYGTNILSEMGERGGRKVSPGALYATLDRLEGKGVVTSRFADPAPGRGGKPKRFMAVTPEGKTALQAARAAWTRMSEGLDGILGDG